MPVCMHLSARVTSVQKASYHYHHNHTHAHHQTHLAKPFLGNSSTYIPMLTNPTGIWKHVASPLTQPTDTTNNFLIHANAWCRKQITTRWNIQWHQNVNRAWYTTQRECPPSFTRRGRRHACRVGWRINQLLHFSSVPLLDNVTVHTCNYLP